MPANPILKIISDYLLEGVRISDFGSNNKTKPAGIVVTFIDGKTKTHSINVNSREEFMGIWKHATACLRLKWEKFEDQGKSAVSTKRAPKKNRP